MKVFAAFRKLFDPIDLTKGSIGKTLIRFWIPIFLSLVLQQVYTVTDTIIVGQTLSESEVAGVSLSGTLVFLIIQFGIGCATGFSVIISERIGAKDESGVRKAYFIQLILGAAVSLFVTGVGLLTLRPLLSLMGVTPSGDPLMQAEFDASNTYLTILFIGAFSFVFYNMIFAVLRAKGDSFVPFLFLLGSTVVNIALDLLFIRVFHWGVAGSALATVLSQTLAAVGAFIYGRFRYPDLQIRKEDTKSPWASYWRHLKNGVPLGFQFSVLSIGILVMTAAVIKFDIDPNGLMVPGLPAQIGYSAGCKIINFLFAPFNALGSATLSFVSQNLGARDRDRILKGIRFSLVFGAILVLICNGIGFLLTINGFYQHLFFSDSKVSAASIHYGNLYLYLCMPCLLFLMALLVIRCALQGLEKPLWPFVGGVSELIARFFFCLWLPALLYGSLNSASGDAAYLVVCLGDAAAWLICPLISLIPLIYHLNPKRFPNLLKRQPVNE